MKISICKTTKIKFKKIVRISTRKVKYVSARHPHVSSTAFVSLKSFSFRGCLQRYSEAQVFRICQKHCEKFQENQRNILRLLLPEVIVMEFPVMADPQ